MKHAGRSSTDQGGGKAATLRHEAKNRASVCSHSPMMRARSLAIGRPGLWEAVLRHVVGFDAERVLDDLGGAVAVVAADRLFEQIGHGHTLTQQRHGD